MLLCDQKFSMVLRTQQEINKSIDLFFTMACDNDVHDYRLYAHNHGKNNIMIGTCHKNSENQYTLMKLNVMQAYVEDVIEEFKRPEKPNSWGDGDLVLAYNVEHTGNRVLTITPIWLYISK